MRLDQYISITLNVSRSDAKKIINKKTVTINEKIVNDSSFKVNDNDIVKYNDKVLVYEEYIYLLMNKPKGYISATFDNHYKTVMDLVNEYQKQNLFPIGRLDIDTTGLLLISNDGLLAHNLLSPSKHVSKTYLVTSKNIVSKEDINKVKDGIMMDNKMTNPIIINKLEDYQYEVIISDGKYHEVKRIFEYINNEVLELRRIRLGNLVLPNDLEEGKYIKLSKEDIDKIR